MPKILNQSDPICKLNYYTIKTPKPAKGNIAKVSYEQNLTNLLI